MDLSKIFDRSAPDFAKNFLREGAVWGPFVVELPSGNKHLGSQLLIEDGVISWIETSDFERATVINGEPEETESSITVQNESGETYVFRTLTEDDWEDLGMESPGSLEEVNNFADQEFAPFELEDDDEE